MPNNDKPYQGDHKATMQQATAKAWTGQPYPAYKDSGVEWLGQVPKHWEVRRLGTFGQFLKGNGGTKADETAEGVPCVRYGDLYTKHQFHITESKSCIAPHRAMAYTPINYGDVLFAGSGETLEEIGKSAVNLIRELAVCGGDVIIFRPTLELDAEFIGWSMDCQQAVSQKAQMGRGITVMHIYSNDLKYLAVALPPLSEQHAITRFLDQITPRIQHHIHAKQKLIKLLEEQKQVIIHQAVTGQINVQTDQPYPAYKDSGVEWLGEVPEHWKLSRVKNEFECLNRKRIPLSSIERGEMTSRRYDYYGASGVIDKVDDYLFDDELLLIAEDGANLVGRNLPLAIIARGKFWVNNHAHILKPWCGSIQFFAWLMESLSYLPWVSGAAQPKLTQDRLMGITLAVPPPSEQDEIVALLQDRTINLTAAIAGAHKEISLVQEYRTCLIADVVTGKLDVREAAVHLPESDPSTVAANCQDGTELADRSRSPHP